MIDYLIIDPSSTEFNRGSFCYLPYIVYSYLSELGYSVKLIEDFTVADMDHLPDAKNTLVSLWSYPQIETCLVIDSLFYRDVEFFGYYPLIKSLNLPVKEISDSEILLGIKSYPEYFSHFKHILLSDCDMHLRKYEGLVYPIFTSYGCPRNCSFCPSSINCNHTRLQVHTPDVLDLLNKCHARGIDNIHFTDEDFFYDIDRAYSILAGVKDKCFNFIALGSVSKVLSFIEKFGQKILIDSGVRLIEVGFESGDSDISKSMNKPSVSIYERLAEISEIDIFWLTITFFPGETIKSLNKTGDFLRKYGHKLDDLYGRVSTNSTEGGLGQFFQLYEGVKDYQQYIDKGDILTARPMRLIPSYIPHSFLNSVIHEVDLSLLDDKWFNLYKLKSNMLPLVKGKEIKELTDSYKGYIFYAICARLGVIK